MKEIEFDLPLDIDDRSFAERTSQTVLIDKSTRILARNNSLGISVKPLQEFRSEGQRLADLKIICLAHADPECEFRWVTVTVGFSKLQGVTIKDMMPRKVVGNPVKMTTTYKGGANFEVEVVPITAGVNFGRDQQIEREVYFPEITSSGVGFSHAQWDFRAGDQAELIVNRDLRLLLEYPDLAKFISVKFTIRAEVLVKGLLSYIPLVGRREVEFAAETSF